MGEEYAGAAWIYRRHWRRGMEIRLHIHSWHVHKAIKGAMYGEPTNTTTIGGVDARGKMELVARPETVQGKAKGSQGQSGTDDITTRQQHRQDAN